MATTGHIASKYVQSDPPKRKSVRFEGHIWVPTAPNRKNGSLVITYRSSTLLDSATLLDFRRQPSAPRTQRQHVYLRQEYHMLHRVRHRPPTCVSTTTRILLPVGDGIPVPESTGHSGSFQNGTLAKDFRKPRF